MERRQSEARAELDRLTGTLVDAGLASWADVTSGHPRR